MNEKSEAATPRPRRRGRWAKRIFGLLLVAGAGAGVWGWMSGAIPEATKQQVMQQIAAIKEKLRPKESAEKKEVFVAKPPSISVRRVATAEIVDSTIVSGSLVAREEINVAPEVDGLNIQEVLVQEGDTVVAGQVLARLSKVSLEIERSRLNAQIARWDAAMAQSRASIAEAKASQDEAAKALVRAKQLRRSQTVSGAVLDQRESSADVAAARVDSAGRALDAAAADKASIAAQLADLEIRVDRTEVKAPSAGVITRKVARVGAVAGMAGGPLFTILAGGEVELEAEVPEAVLPKLNPGQSVKVTPTGFEKPIDGSIRMIMPEIDAQTRLGKVRISLPGDARLRLGSFSRATIEIGRRQGLEVPVSALSFDGGSNFVQVVVDGIVRSRLVKVGLVARGKAEILTGLIAGEDVVERAGSFLRDGDKIVAIKAEQQAAMNVSSSQ